MAKAKGAALPLKNQKKSIAPKASEITARKKPSQLSEELVVDSDSDSVPENSKGQSGFNNESVRRKSNAEAIKAATSEKTKPPSPPMSGDTSSEDDEEEVEGSSSSSESRENIADAVPTSSKKPVQPPQVNGVKRKVQDQSSSESESEESSESSDEQDQEPGSKAKKVRTSSSETSESSEDNESSTVEGKSASSKAKQKDTSTSPLESSRTVKAKPFQPPAGYVPLDPQAFEAWAIVDRRDLEGAQIWHIAAPSSVPLTSIAGMTLDSIEKGEPILKHNGIDYIFQSEPSNTSEGEFLMLPGEHDYEASPIPISRRLHLQQRIVLPNLTRKQANPDTGSGAAADIARTAVSTIRPQPKGLRMRYKPTGFGPGRPGIIGSESDSDNDDNQAQQTLQFPAAMGAHGVAGKDGPSVHDTGRTEQAVKKKHKKKKEILVNGEATPKKPRSNSVDTPMVDSVMTVPESKEDKAKRKEEKRRRKEAKKAGRLSKGSDAL